MKHLMNHANNAKANAKAKCQTNAKANASKCKCKQKIRMILYRGENTYSGETFLRR